MSHSYMKCLLDSRHHADPLGPNFSSHQPTWYILLPFTNSEILSGQASHIVAQVSQNSHPGFGVLILL